MHDGGRVVCGSRTMNYVRLQHEQVGLFYARASYPQWGKKYITVQAFTFQEGPNLFLIVWFLQFLLKFESAACFKKKGFQQPSIPTKVWSFLFCHGLSEYLLCLKAFIR